MQKLLSLGFLLFHIQVAGMHVLQTSWEILVKQLLFNKIVVLQPANAIKTKFLAISFLEFCLRFRDS